MARQIIGLGSVADDGTGDTARVAGGKINDNFVEVYESAWFGGPYSNRHLAVTAAATRSNNASNAAKAVPANVLHKMSATGIRYRKGTGTSAANVIVALYNAAGTRLAVSATTAQGTTASAVLSVAFSGGAVTIDPGLYWLYWIGSSTSADFFGWPATGEYLGPMYAVTEGSFAAPATITLPALSSLSTAQVVPFLTLY